MYRPDVPTFAVEEAAPKKKSGKKREYAGRVARVRPNTLLEAVLSGDVHSLRYLCTERVSYSPNEEDALAMRMACKTGNLEVIGLLLDAGLDPALGLGSSDPAVQELLHRQPGVAPLPIDRELDEREISAMIDY